MATVRAQPWIVRRALAVSDAWKFSLAVWGVSRLFFLAVGAVAARFVTPAAAGVVPEPPGFLNYWAHWDGAWYSAIATSGYGGPAATAFFPFYPLLVHFGTRLGGGPAVWGVVISSLALLLALFFLYRIAEELWDQRVARIATLTLAFFPTAFFLNAVYTEALFLALTTGALWAAYVRRDLVLAGFFAYFAGATRNVGLLLVIPLAYEWLRNRREFGWVSLVGVAAAPCGLATYMLYLWKGTDDPLLFAAAQEQTWGRTFTNPVTTVERAWESARGGFDYVLHPGKVFAGTYVDPSYALGNSLQLFFLALLFVLLALAVVRLSPGLSAYALLLGAAPLLTPSPMFPLTGLSRYFLGMFPLFFVLAFVLARSRYALLSWLVASAAFGAFLTILFTSWRWVA